MKYVVLSIGLNEPPWPLLNTIVDATARFAFAPAAVDAPVPPSATARSVILTPDPPVIATLDAACVAIEPKPSVVRWAVALASSSSARPAAVIGVPY